MDSLSLSQNVHFNKFCNIPRQGLTGTAGRCHTTSTNNTLCGNPISDTKIKINNSNRYNKISAE